MKPAASDEQTSAGRLRSLTNHPALAAVLIAGAVAALLGVLRYTARVKPLRQHLYQGIEYIRQGKGPEAERQWKEALRLDPNGWEAWKLLGEYYASTGRWSEAREAWQQVRKLGSREKHQHLLCQLSLANWNVGDEVSAWKLAEQEIGADPHCVRALSLGAHIADGLGDNKKAIAYLREAAKQRPDDPVLLGRLGEYLVGLHDYREARVVLERHIELAPDQADAYGLLAVTYLNDPEMPDRLERAKRLLYKALELNPLSADARLHVGRLWLMQDNPEKAVLHLKKAASLAPMKWRPFHELTRAYERLGQKAKAEKSRRRFLELQELASEETLLEKRCSLEKNNFEYHYRLGMIKLRKGDLRVAAFFLQRAAEIKPGDAATAMARKAVRELIQGTATLVDEHEQPPASLSRK